MTRRWLSWVSEVEVVFPPPLLQLLSNIPAEAASVALSTSRRDGPLFFGPYRSRSRAYIERAIQILLPIPVGEICSEVNGDKPNGREGECQGFPCYRSFLSQSFTNPPTSSSATLADHSSPSASRRAR